MSPPPIPSASQYYIANLSLGNLIALAFGFLVLFLSILSCCICFNRWRINRDPSIIIIGEDNNENDNVNEIHDVRQDQPVINSYPKFPFLNRTVKDIDPMCAICLSEYREAEMMRMLPDCKHCFHQICVDAWLELKASCPICRNRPLRAPSSSPLAEVFPFSQYSSDGRHLRHIVDVNEPGPSQARA